jgi:hypothetical protein
MQALPPRILHGVRKEGRGACLHIRLRLAAPQADFRPPAETQSALPLPSATRIGEIPGRYKRIYRQSFGPSALEWHSVTLVGNGRNKECSGFSGRQHTVCQHIGDWSWRPYMLDAAAALGTESSSDRCWRCWPGRHRRCIRRVGSRYLPRCLAITGNTDSAYRSSQCDWKACFAPTTPFLFQLKEIRTQRVKRLVHRAISLPRASIRSSGGISL